MLFISNLFVTFFYIGKSPLAPGTLGSFMGVVLWYYLISIDFLYLMIFFIFYTILSYILITLELNYIRILFHLTIVDTIILHSGLEEKN